MAEENEVKPKATRKRSASKRVTKKDLESLYVLKFNSPVLPFSKFPLTQNKYI